jgi:hypothetical protein
MPHPSFGPTLDASGVLASRLLEFLANKRPSAQEKLGDKRLGEARDLAERDVSLIDPKDMKIARDKVLQCVLFTNESVLGSTACQRCGSQGGVGIKEWPFEISTSAGIQEVCQRGSPVC